MSLFATGPSVQGPRVYPSLAETRRLARAGGLAAALFGAFLSSCERGSTAPGGGAAPPGFPGSAAVEPGLPPASVSLPGSRPPPSRVTADPNALTPDQPENVVVADGG